MSETDELFEKRQMVISAANNLHYELNSKRDSDVIEGKVDELEESWSEFALLHELTFDFDVSREPLHNVYMEAKSAFENYTIEKVKIESVTSKMKRQIKRLGCLCDLYQSAYDSNSLNSSALQLVIEIDFQPRLNDAVHTMSELMCSKAEFEHFILMPLTKQLNVLMN